MCAAEDESAASSPVGGKGLSPPARVTLTLNLTLTLTLTLTRTRTRTRTRTPTLPGAASLAPRGVYVCGNTSSSSGLTVTVVKDAITG